MELLDAWFGFKFSALAAAGGVRLGADMFGDARVERVVG